MPPFVVPFGVMTKKHTGTNESQVMQHDEFWMSEAIVLAQKASEAGEVPVGALIVKDQHRISHGWNQPIQNNDPTAHAEIIALRGAGSTLRNYRMPGATLYVTLEPCVMCMGAISQARVKRVVFGAYDPIRGAAGSILQLADASFLNHRVQVTPGVMQETCSKILLDFFKNKR